MVVSPVRVVLNPTFRQQFNIYASPKNVISTLNLWVSPLRHDLSRRHCGLSSLSKRDLWVIPDANLILALVWLSISEIPGFSSRGLDPKEEASMVGHLLRLINGFNDLTFASVNKCCVSSQDSTHTSGASSHIHTHRVVEL